MTIEDKLNNIITDIFNPIFSQGLLLGVIIGIVICLIIQNKVNGNKIVKQIKDNINIKNFIFIGTCLITIVLFISSLLGISISNATLSTILNFAVSFVFAFMFNEYSNDKSFKEKQKEPAMRSYRHSINILSKLDYGIETTKLIELDFENCDGKNNNGCNFIANIHRVRDLLKTIRMDCVENINDWADVLSEDLNKISEIDAIKNEIENKTKYIQDENKTIPNLETHLKEVSELKTKVKKLKEEMDPRLKNTLDIKQKYENDYIKEIQQEIKMKRASNARRGLDLSILFRSKDIDKSS